MNINVKNFASAGKAARWNVRYVCKQLGSDGCRRPQERVVREGWAGEVTGEISLRVGGRVFSRLGKRMGEVKGGQLRRDISARQSTMVFVVGHGRLAG